MGEIGLYIFYLFPIVINKKVVGEIQEIHKELTMIRKKLEGLEEIILPSEKIPERKLNELRKLKDDSLEEYVEWDENRDIF